MTRISLGAELSNDLIITESVLTVGKLAGGYKRCTWMLPTCPNQIIDFPCMWAYLN